MKVTVLGGSPKGETSVTMQYVEFLKTNFSEHEFAIHQPAFNIAALEKEKTKFDPIMNDVRDAGLVLWAFPLYVFTICSQYQRFIELIEENGRAESFRGKYAAALSTSIHFFDHTAHNYIRAVSDDLGMNFTGSFSAHMNDLLDAKMRKNLILFFENSLSMARAQVPVTHAYSPIRREAVVYTPGALPAAIDSGGKKVVIVTDGNEGNTGKMIKRLSAAFQPLPELVDISALDIKGGCLGCLKCGPANVCSYTDKDAFIEMFREKIMKADIIFYAGAMKGRHLSSRWKMFFDRSFFNTHQRALPGKQLAFLISGPLSQNFNLREILTAYAEWQNANLVDIVTDEKPENIDAAISNLAEKAVEFSGKGYLKPVTFLGFAGMKVFRDDVYSDLRVVFRADHRVYKKTGVFDFPQNKPFKNFMLAVMSGIIGIPWVTKKVTGNFKKIMIMPYRGVIKLKIRDAKEAGQ
ncbi:MAG: NAD(P)H-dependent oxidoreductase [Candidatus Goldiibacteriota bacterium]|jgi:multimeric flavodoxin WrbA